MKRIRYALPLLILFPTLALAQADSIRVQVEGVQYPGFGAIFGARFPPPGMNIGPLPIVPVAGTGETGDLEEGCDSLVNADQVAGNIALVLRGSCTFVQKVKNAVAAGAEAVVVRDDECCAGCDSCETYVVMAGECEPDVCSIPAMFISRWAGLQVMNASGPTEATLIPIRVAMPVAVEEVVPIEGFVLHPIYPNPAKSHSTISLDLPTARAVRVAVFDVLGREVAVLHDGSLPAGPHTLVLDAVRLPAGLYVVRATGEGFRATRKLVVMR